MKEKEKAAAAIRYEIEANLHNCVSTFPIRSRGGLDPYAIMCELITKGSCYGFMIKKVRSWRKGSKGDVLFEMEYSLGRYTLRNMVLESEKKAAEICGVLLRPEMSPLLKAFVVHRYLLDTVVYDYENYRGEVENPLRNSQAHSAYGALLKGRSVCQGIADAFKMIMDVAGEKCISVIGEAKGGDDNAWGGHAWNLYAVRDDCYMHIDATFDIGYQKVDKYRYFAKNDLQVKSDHRWKKGLYPDASDNFNALWALRKELFGKRRQLRASGVPAKYLRI